jgi:nucleotide-binding universal stress UspA family protein
MENTHKDRRKVVARKILLAVDGTERGLESVSVLGRLLKDQPGLQLVLFHCVQQLSSLLPGDLCMDVEDRCKISFGDQEKLGGAVLAESRKRLVQAGFPEDRIESKLKVNSMDPAQDIIAEADYWKIRTIALGRRGRSQVEALLLGSVSGKVAQYAQHKTVWIVDAPVHESGKVLLAMEDAPESRELTAYAAEFVAPSKLMQFTFLHLMPPVPPTFWDDGHILGPSEQKDRQSRIEKWRSEWKERVSKFMSDGMDLLAREGVPQKNLVSLVLPTKLGIARDLLTEISEHKFQMVIMGKKSFHERKPFLMGSHASKVMQSVKAVVLCLVDY